MFRLSAGTGNHRLHDTKQCTPGVDGPAAPAVDRAIDCWCHGVTHLLSALGPEAALSLMARTVVDLVDRNTATQALRDAPPSA